MTEIYLFPVGVVDLAILEFLSVVLKDSLNMSCLVRDESISLDGTFDAMRRQYYSTKLLARLLQFQAGRNVKLLGVADVDLFVPPLAFIFGEAQFGNPAALISVYRLREEFYGLPENSERLLARSEKEAVHEIGHTLGLIHCRNYQCAMYLSNSVEDIDLKTNTFCPTCAEIAMSKNT